uniref:LRAT domain-containing protein n=1 Tax=Panagrolaimus sp. JU765 TaxID=591449 RepID=A0AC34QTQ0_9BILA
MKLLEFEVQEKLVPEIFRERVDQILKCEFMGEEVDRIWGKTNFGQHFVFVISKVALYAVRWIVDEEYWNFRAIHHENVDSDYVYENRWFITLKKAKTYISNRLKDVSEDNFGGQLRYRLRMAPQDILQNPDKYLRRGTHLQRYLKGDLFRSIGFGSHEGIYLGNGKVAHMSTEKHATLSTISKARPRIDTVEKFLDDPNDELRIVDHCFRERDPMTIVGNARSLVGDFYYIESYPPVYNIFRNNCQHFATFCVNGRAMITELKQIINNVATPKAIITLLKALQVGVNKVRHNEDD